MARAGLTAGERFGPYDILGPLGAGGMGIVYRARDTRLGREVAIKTLPPESVTDVSRLQRFEAEARAASALNHPNVVAVFDVGREGDTPYLVTELLQGQTLRERLDEGPLAPRKVIELGVQVAHGLAAVHEKGIVHRDLKPENLFLTRDAQLKILDFGVARTSEGLAPPTGTLPLTQSGAVMGTAGYMSPEQVRGRVADARSDLFSLGAILFECLGGARAFPGETPVERGYAILNAEPAELKAPSALVRVVRRCLEKDPDQRFQTARDLAFALESATEGSAPQAVSARSRWPTVALAGIGAVVALSVLAVLTDVRREAPVATPASPPVVEPAKPPVSRRVTFRNGSIYNARFTSDGRGIAYAGAFESTPPRVYSGVLDGPQLRPASGPGTMLFDVSEKDELALGDLRAEASTRAGLVLSRSSLAGGAARPLYEGVTWADFGPQDAMVLTRFADSMWSIEFPPGHVVVSSPQQVEEARLSPDGSMIAFLRHPVVGDDRGTVEIIDRTGKLLTKSNSAWTMAGLAWAPSGQEVWFSAGYDDVARQIYALSLEGTQRLVYGGPGSLRLLDIDPKGRLLAVTGILRSRMFGLVAGDTRERSLSWLDGSMPLDLAPDGTALLFLEGFGPAGTEVQTWFRRFEQPDDTPVLLSLGWGRALSPDQRWAIITPTPPFNTLRLVPTGVGAQRELPGGDFESIGFVRYFPDGQRIAFSAVDASHRQHLYVQSVLDAETETGPVQVSDEELSLVAPPSPDGKWLVGYSGKSKRATLVPVGDPKSGPRVLERLVPGDLPVQWTADGKSLWLMRQPKLNAEISVQVLRYELATGKTIPVTTLHPADAVGMDHIRQGLLAPDGRHYVYTAHQSLDELYLIEGVH